MEKYYVFFCLFQDLPSSVGEESSSVTGTVPDSKTTVPGQSEMDQMQIAWRYQNLPKVQVHVYFHDKIEIEGVCLFFYTVIFQ